MKHVDTEVGAALLAAGSASRYGAAKQVLLIDGEPMVRRAALNALAAGLHPVVVVIGAHGDAVAACLKDLDVHLVDNPEWATGMGSSLALGVTALTSHATSLGSIMVLLADQPSITAADLRGMLEAHALAPQRILASRHKDRPGPPCLFPVAYAKELSAMRGPRGARPLLEKHAASVDTYDLPSALFDIDTPADHAAWQAHRRAVEGDADT